MGKAFVAPLNNEYTTRIDFDIEFWIGVYTKESYDTYLAAKQKAEKLLTDENAT